MGSVLVFVPMLAGFMILLYATAVFASHYVLTVIESTASGNEEVVWPTESPTEWLWKPFYLGWLGFLSAAPGALAGAAAVKPLGPVDGFLIGLAGFLFVYPVAQLSAFVSDHPWVPLNAEAVGRLFARPGVTFGFYLIAAALVPAVGLALYLAFGPWTVGPLAGGVLLAVTVFAYARAVGRLLFALTYEPPARRAGGPRRKRKTATPPPDPEPEPTPVRPPSTWEDEDNTPYAALPAEVQADQVIERAAVEPKESELKLLAPATVRASGPAWGLTVWTTFFGRSRTIGACGALALFFVAVFAVFRTLLTLNPAGRG